MGCRVGNRSSHRRSFRVRNDLPEWENTDRPVMRSTWWNILVASLGRRGECERPVTNQFEGTGVVLGAQLTRRNLYHRVGGSKSRILICSFQTWPSPEKSSYRNVSFCIQHAKH